MRRRRQQGGDNATPGEGGSVGKERPLLQEPAIGGDADGPASGRPRPRELLRRRRPGYFSDTLPTSAPRLDRAVFEYHLSTLTSRSQELAFEHFAFELCKRAIAPNLLPHTGPSGGGDSRVDSETFPVSSELALTWFVADASDAAQERWAFAFSAKAAWKPKLKSDVKKIAETGRGYRRAFFVSNQMIRDQDRAAVEDELRDQYGIDVRVLDRNWVVDRVFDGRHEALAIGELGIQVSAVEPMGFGPLDASRQQRLAEIETDIQASVEAMEVGPRVVDLALEAAVISRELELARDVVEGRLDRAARLADRHGTQSQVERAAYERAWTTFWWFEDGPAFKPLVEAYERRTAGTTSLTALRGLVSLYQLSTSGIAGSWEPESSWVDARRATVTSELDRIAGIATAPGASLSARMLVQMLVLVHEPAQADQAYEAMRELIDEGKALIGFDFDEFASVLTELSSMVPQSNAFESLLAAVIDEIRARTGDIAAGEALSRRAAQLYDSERYAEAIGSAGKALPLLFRHEAKPDLLRALDIIGDSYVQVGLLWAARAAWLTAATVAAPEAGHPTDWLPQVTQILDRIRRLELLAGRLPQALSVHRLYGVVAAATAVDRARSREGLWDSALSFDAALAQALLRLPVSDLRWLTRAPDLLGRYGLELAQGALLMALGYEEQIPESLGEREAVLKWFQELEATAGQCELQSDQLSGRTATLTSRVLGVAIKAEHERGSPAAQLAESILGSTEALLSTGLAVEIVGRVPELRIRVRRGHLTPFPFRIADRADVELEVAYADFDPAALTLEQQRLLQDELYHLVLVEIGSRGFHFGADMASLERLLGGERAHDRAVGFATSFVTEGDLLGDTHRHGLDALFDGSERDYPIQATARQRARSSKGSEPRLTTPRAPGGRDHRSTPHTAMRVLSVIDIPRWDAARWRGVAYLAWSGEPPILALGFQNTSAAQQIWTGWQTQRHGRKLSDVVEVSIVTDIDPMAPLDYYVLVGPHLETSLEPGDRLAFFATRCLRMSPSSSGNLALFRSLYEASGCYELGFTDLATAAGGVVSRTSLIGTAPMDDISIESLDALDQGDVRREVIRQAETESDSTD